MTCKYVIDSNNLMKINLRKSEDVYATQTDLNAMSAQTAYEDEARQLEEIRKERTFDQQDAYLDSLLTEGKLRANESKDDLLRKVIKLRLMTLVLQ